MSGAAWTTESGPVAWPAGYFSTFWGPGVAVRVMGSGVVDGHGADIVAFVRPELPAWLWIWVDRDDGHVRREEVRAESHLMDHTGQGSTSPSTWR